jgi:hypothetical protein
VVATRAVGLLLAWLATGCSGDLPLEDRPCPCLDGWTCCESTNRCVSDMAECKPSDGPRELTRLLGTPGGRGTADGIGRDARFNNPESIVGDDEFVYVSDELGWSLEDEDCLISCTSITCGYDGPCEMDDDCAAKCPVYGLPAGVRRIARASGQVDWLVANRYMRHLALVNDSLFAGLLSPHFPDFNTIQTRARAIARIDPSSGSVTEVAGLASADPPRDGFGTDARFKDIRGLAGDDNGTIYVADADALRAFDASSGRVTTLLAGENWRTEWQGEEIASAHFVSLGAVAVHQGRFVYAIEEKRSSGSHTLWKYDVSTGGLEPKTAPSDTADETRALCISSYGDAFSVTGDCVTAWWLGVEHSPVYVDSSCEASSAIAGVVTKPRGIWCAEKGSAYISDAGSSTVWELPSFFKRATAIAGERAHAGEEIDRPSAIAAGSKRVVVRNGDSFDLIVGFPGHPDLFVRQDLAALGFDSLGPFALGPTGTLYFDGGRGGMSGIWALGPDIPTVSLLSEGSCEALAHDGVRTLYCSLGCEIRRIDDTTGTDTILNEPKVSRTCSVMALGDAQQLFVKARSYEYEPTEILFRLVLETGDFVPLPEPEDGWNASALAYDPRGVLYVAEASRQRVRGLALETGQIFDVAGKQGSQGVQLGSLPASLNSPSAIAVLSDGALAIADYNENVVLLAR